MSFKNWCFNLVVQVFSVIWAIWLFSSPLDRKISGLLAGAVFLGAGLLPLLCLRKNPLKKQWISFWAALLFLIFSAVPIFALRLIFWDQEFNTIEIAGFPAAQLHSWSSSLFMALIMATLIDGLRFFILKKDQIKVDGTLTI